MKSLPMPKAFIEIEVRDKKGKILEKRREEAHSWVGNFIKALYGLLATSAIKNTTISIIDTENQSIGFPQVPSESDSVLFVKAVAGNDDFGIIVGSGNTPVTLDDYNLEAKIPHGTGTGQIQYNYTTMEEPVISDNNISFRIIRTFTNVSGGDIIVREIGLVALKYSKYFLIARDVLETPVTVPHEATLTVRYIISYSLG